MRPVWILAGSALVAACGGGAPAGGGEPDSAPGGGDDAGAVATAGELVIVNGGGYGHIWPPPVVFGSVWGSTPPVWHTEVAREGACRVLGYQTGFCDQCSGVCLAPDECRPWPDYLSAGAVTVRGLAGGELRLEPEFDQRYQTWGGLPDPLFADDAVISIEAAGDEVGPFSGTVAAVARLTVPAIGSGCAKMHDCAKLGIMRYARAAASTDRGEVALVAGSGADYPLGTE